MLLEPEHVVLDSQARSKRAAITELAETLGALDPDQVLEVVMARERLGSTGMGHGVALPHGKIANLERPILALARHAAGLDFDAVDGEPVHIVALLLVPEGREEEGLALLARLARMLQREENRRAIMQARTAQEIAALFEPMERSEPVAA